MDVDKREREEIFRDATQFVRQNSSDFDANTLLFLYSRYKQATEGPCSIPKPGFFDFQGKQKWEAWKSVGSMEKSQAMLEYIEAVEKHEPQWETKYLLQLDNSTLSKHENKNTMGVCVSTHVKPNDEIADDQKTVFDWCQEGNTNQVMKILNSGNVDIDEKDAEGMSLLHWACDRGLCEMVKMLLKNGASINLQDDSDKQTPLHFATFCCHEEIIKILLSHGADKTITNCDGDTAVMLDSSPEIKDILENYTAR